MATCVAFLGRQLRARATSPRSHQQGEVRPLCLTPLVGMKLLIWIAVDEDSGVDVGGAGARRRPSELGGPRGKVRTRFRVCVAVAAGGPSPDR